MSAAITKPTSRVVLGALLALGVCSAPAWAVESQAAWHFAPARVPPPPSGLTPAFQFVDVGPVGQISFWAPNRGLLIEGGTEALREPTPAVPAGLYAYNGASWHLLSEQCGGGEGRIAWAGPDEFWTISDQRGGQDLPEKEAKEKLKSISLCHFLNGQIVGSYAMPLGQPGSYLRMDAAACYSPSDCWFGGETGAGEHPGAFHLHWDGTGVSVVYNGEDHAVTGMVDYDGHLLESVQMSGGGIPGEPEHPALFHTIAPGGPSPFSDLFLFSSETGELLPEYKKEQERPQYIPEGFELASDGLGLGGEAKQLWATANPESERRQRSPTVLRCEGNACLAGAWSQLTPTPTSLGGTEILTAPAPEPGSADAWVSLQTREGEAEIALLGPTGVLRSVILPEAGEKEVGERGVAGPIACPAANDCWMATSEGWLYHYTNGASLPVDEDPNFAGVITYRPLDAGVSTLYPNSFAEETNSPIYQSAPTPPPVPQINPTPPRRARRRELVTHIHAHFVHRREFVLTFTLLGTARVGLVARRGKRVVARVRARTLRAGRHKLSFAFNPTHPPTTLQFNATPPGGGSGGASRESAGGGSGSGGPGAGSSGGSSTIET